MTIICCINIDDLRNCCSVYMLLTDINFSAWRRLLTKCFPPFAWQWNITGGAAESCQSWGEKKKQRVTTAFGEGEWSHVCLDWDDWRVTKNKLGKPVFRQLKFRLGYANTRHGSKGKNCSGLTLATTAKPGMPCFWDMSCMTRTLCPPTGLLMMGVTFFGSKSNQKNKSVVLEVEHQAECCAGTDSQYHPLTFASTQPACHTKGSWSWGTQHPFTDTTGVQHSIASNSWWLNAFAQQALWPVR